MVFGIVPECRSASLRNERSALPESPGRARRLFRASGAFVEVAGAADIPQCLDAVYQAIYLLFIEGYHGTRSEIGPNSTVSSTP